jgi:hypothetical protein
MTYQPNWRGSYIFSDGQRRVIAFHEAGHAVAAAYAHLEITGKPYFVERIAVARCEGGIATTGYDGRKGYCNGLCRMNSTVLGFYFRLNDSTPQSLRIDRNKAVWFAAYFLAGPYAELLYIKSKETFASRYSPDLRGQSTADFDYAERQYQLIQAAPGRKISYQSIHRKSRDLIADRWEVVVKLAEAVFAHDELFTSDVERVIGPVIRENAILLAA